MSHRMQHRRNPICTSSTQSYQSSYESDYLGLLESTKLEQPVSHPASPTRMNRPHPTKVFLFNRFKPNEEECKVWTPLDAKHLVRFLSATPLSNSQSSYKDHRNHPDYSAKPLPSFRGKTGPASGIIPNISVTGLSSPLVSNNQASYISYAKDQPTNENKLIRYGAEVKPTMLEESAMPVSPELIKVTDICNKMKTKIIGPQSGYDLTLPMHLAMEDMHRRAVASNERCHNQAIPGPCRRRHLPAMESHMGGANMQMKIIESKSNCAINSYLHKPPSYHKYY